MRSMFQGSRAFIYAYRNRNAAPMSFYWRWLAAKWKYDVLCAVALIVNFYIIPLALMGGSISFLANAFSALDQWFDRFFSNVPPLVRFDVTTAEQRIIYITNEYRKAIES